MDTKRHVKGKKHRYTVFKGQLKYYLSKISNMSDSRLLHPCLFLVTIMILKVPLNIDEMALILDFFKG